MQAVVELLDQGNTVPFITRYRKDQTGGLNEEQIRQIQARLNKLRLLADRKQTILRSIHSQGKLTEELQREILAADTLKRLEDLYLPFKPRKQTLATVARSRGLEQLAAEILAAHPLCADLDARAKDFISVERKVASAAEALLGAGHILAEQFSENARLRQRLREILQRTGKFVCCQAATVSVQVDGSSPRKAKDSSQIAGSAASASRGANRPKQPAVAGEQAVVAADSDGATAANISGPNINSQTTGDSRKAAENRQEVATSGPAQDIHQRQEVATGDYAQDSMVPVTHSAGDAGPIVSEAPSAVGRQALLPFMAEDGGVAQWQQLSASAAQAAVGWQAKEATARAGLAGVGQVEWRADSRSGETVSGSPESVSGSAEPIAKPVEVAPVLFEELRSDQAGATTGQADRPGQSSQEGRSDRPWQSDQVVEPQTGPEPAAAAAPRSGQPAVAAPVVARQTAVAAARPSRKQERLSKRQELRKKRLEERRIKAFRDYFDYQEEMHKIPPHRLLAINRGERAGILKVKLEYDLPAMHQVLEEMLIPPEHPHADYLRGCARDALSRLILPSLEREVRRELTDKAEAHAVEVFAKNLRNLLLQPPVRDHRVLAIDPGFKSGCKVVALDQFGNVLEHGVIYLVGKAERCQQAKEKLIDLIDRHQLTLIAIGNGTACRHTEDFVARLLDAELKGRGIAYVIVNEAGASAYSTSQVGREELPQYDASVRGAVSIGRRLLDPLSELVKIDPANIGVGMYQHDVKAKHLRASLDEVVASCVNFVGVDANTASPALLRYVSGLNQLTARRLYEYRREHGPFQSREQLREVPGIGEATFVQAAGFLRITGGTNPLDATWIHPESYEVTAQLLAHLGFTASDLNDKHRAAQLAERAAAVDRAVLARQLGVGAHTLEDILSQLVRPGRDPREDFPQPVFKHGPMKLEDLVPGMELSGTVSNVVDFGAFVDIGMHDSGLVHVSHLSDRFVRDPHEVVAVGDVVRVWVLNVDKERRRVSLAMVKPGTERQRRAQQAQPAEGKQSDAKSTPARSVGQQGVAAQAAPATPTGQPVADEQQPAAKDARSQNDLQRGAPVGRSAATPAEGKQPSGRQGGRSRDRDTKPPPRRSSERSGYKPKPKPKPVVRITEAMRAGKEPMRTFGELLQFYAERQQQQSAEGKQPQQPSRSMPGGSQDQLEQQRPADSASETPAVATPDISKAAMAENPASAPDDVHDVQAAACDDGGRPTTSADVQNAAGDNGGSLQDVHRTAGGQLGDAPVAG